MIARMREVCARELLILRHQTAAAREGGAGEFNFWIMSQMLGAALLALPAVLALAIIWVVIRRLIL